MKPRLLAGAMVVAATTVAMGSAASLGASASLSVTIDRTVQLGTGGKVVAVGGLVRCTGGQRIRLRLAVIQLTTGAYAEGTLPESALCSGALQRWKIATKFKGTTVFARGNAQVCVLATTHRKARYTALVQSCKTVGVTK